MKTMKLQHFTQEKKHLARRNYESRIQVTSDYVFATDGHILIKVSHRDCFGDFDTKANSDFAALCSEGFSIHGSEWAKIGGKVISSVAVVDGKLFFTDNSTKKPKTIFVEYERGVQFPEIDFILERDKKRCEVGSIALNLELTCRIAQSMTSIDKGAQFLFTGQNGQIRVVSRQYPSAFIVVMPLFTTEGEVWA